MNTEYLSRCIQTLEASESRLRGAVTGSVEYEVFRNAAVKGFELALETAGKLLRKALKLYVGNPRSVDELTFKEVLRTAAKHSLVESTEVERWFSYRDNRNNTAHDYGEGFAEETLALLPLFIADIRRLESTLKQKLGNENS